MRYPFEIITEFEVKSLSHGALELRGYASTFGNMDYQRDVVDEHAFDETMQQYMQSPVMLAFHDQRLPIGSIQEAHIDEQGLYVVGLVPEAKSAEAQNVRNQIESGEIHSFSIGGYFHRKSLGSHNLIHRVDLVEISVVKNPANPWASFTLGGSMQKSLEHKSLFPLAYETKELPEGKERQPMPAPMEEFPFSIYVEGAGTPDFLGYWFGVKVPGLSRYMFQTKAKGDDEAYNLLHRLKEYSERAGVEVIVQTPYVLKV